jgi:hypothetical protein
LRKQFQIAVALSILAAFNVTAVYSQNAPSTRPNIVFIMGDDVGW